MRAPGLSRFLSINLSQNKITAPEGAVIYEEYSSVTGLGSAMEGQRVAGTGLRR